MTRPPGLDAPHHQSMSIDIRIVAAFVLAGTLVSATTAGACDVCAIYTGTLGQQEKTGFVLGIGEQYADFGTIRRDGHEIPNPHHEWIHSSITQLLVAYAFTSWFSIQANVPLISREYHRLEDGVPVRGDASGLGDVSFLAKVAPFSGPVGSALVYFELLAGVKTPTGSGSRLAEELAEPDGELAMVPRNSAGSVASASRSPRHEGHPSAVHGHDLALGTGSVDGIVGFGLHGSWKRLFAGASVQYVIRTKGDHGYEFANELTWEAGPGVYLLTDDRYTAALQFVVSGEDKSKDEQNGVIADDTAITAVYLGPALLATWKSDLQLRFAVDVPVLQHETETQIVTDYRLRGGIVWHF